VNGHANANGHVRTNSKTNGGSPSSPKSSTKRKGKGKQRRLKTPFAPRKSTAGFLAACVTGALVALGFWCGVAGLRGVKGVAEMRAVKEGEFLLAWTTPLSPSLRLHNHNRGTEY
jgi:hypothetical protein